MGLKQVFPLPGGLIENLSQKMFKFTPHAAFSCSCSAISVFAPLEGSGGGGGGLLKKSFIRGGSASLALFYIIIDWKASLPYTYYSQTSLIRTYGHQRDRTKCPQQTHRRSSTPEVNISIACQQKEYYPSLLLLLIHIILFLAIKKNRETADPKHDFPANFASTVLKKM